MEPSGKFSKQVLDTIGDLKNEGVTLETDSLYKYPRTLHLPWSDGVSDDDKVLKDVSHLLGRRVIATLKMDGENTTMYPDAIHARSLDSKDHESRHYVKALHAGIRTMIPKHHRICGENLYAKHSIYYDDLPAYFMVFSIWCGDTCLSWSRTIQICIELGLYKVPFFFAGTITGQETFDFIHGKFVEFFAKHEGYVLRIEDNFTLDNFQTSVAKYVREGHVQTDKHWMHQKVVPNKLK